MKNMLLIIMFSPLLCSCEATGRLAGSIARLPVDIVRAGTGMYQEGEAPNDFSGTIEEPLNAQ